jgi:hypothetical protein
MAVEYPGFGPTSYLAGADLSAVKYRFVMANTTAGQVVLTTAGSHAVGVMQEGAITGAAVPVLRAPARSKVTAGATLTAGQKLAAGALGVAVPWVSGYAVAGWAESASVTSGLVTVTLATLGGTA